MIWIVYENKDLSILEDNCKKWVFVCYYYVKYISSNYEVFGIVD